jgi:hypothetical protein
MDNLASGDTPGDLRKAMLDLTSAGSDRKRRLHGNLEIEALTHVHADRLCEIVEYRYLVASQGLALQLCRDADADDTPPEIQMYVLRHRSLFSNCGGFELLAARYQTFSVDEYIALNTVARPQPKRAQERRAFLRGLL